MKSPLIIQEIASQHTPESLVDQLKDQPHTILLRSALFDSPETRYSFITSRPFLTFRSLATRCEVRSDQSCRVLYGNPWRILDRLMARYELLDEVDFPFPLGGCFGFWGYDLKNFVEPRLPRTAVYDLELPDCQVGFYDSLVVFDHRLDKCWIVSVGLQADGSQDAELAKRHFHFWRAQLETNPPDCPAEARGRTGPKSLLELPPPRVQSNLTRSTFLDMVAQAQCYIQAGDIYQVNLAQRLSAALSIPSFDFFKRLLNISPSPFAAWMDAGDFQIMSSSPEQFLRLSGAHVQTRPIKGTRPRSSDPTRDAQWTYELQTSSKEMAELVMITDLLRNDLGRVCEYGSVQVPELVRLERFPQVQHLVSTVEGRLRPDLTHLATLAQCFPGGSITGAPKIRAMEIIDELEPQARGPYTGCLGYLGFNQESQLSILIRTAVLQNGQCHFHVGAGIVADSDPAAEYDETMAKAAGFLSALAPIPAPHPGSDFPGPPPARKKKAGKIPGKNWPVED